MKKYSVILFLLFTYGVKAQDLLEYYDSIKTTQDHSFKNKLDKKFLWGFHYNLSWSTVEGIDDLDIFTKPSVGAAFKVNYFPVDWLGFSVGAGHQMRGFGVYTPDVFKELGDPDSTHRLRIRTNNLDLPVQVILRTPFEFWNVGKFSLSLGVTPTMVYMARSVFISVEDGFHKVEDIKNQFISGFDFPLHAGAGVEINAANATLLRLHFFAEFGSKPTYINPVTGSKSGANRLFGLQMSFLF